MKVYIITAWFILWQVVLLAYVVRVSWQHRRDAWTAPSSWPDLRHILKLRMTETARIIAVMGGMTAIYAAGLFALWLLP